MPHSAKALRMEELDLCLYLSFSHIRLFVFCHPDNVRIYIPYLTPSFAMEVFYFSGVRIWITIHDDILDEWKQDFGRGVIIFFTFNI